MTNKRDLAKVGNDRQSPVRVKLQRVNADASKSHPPCGQHQDWWNRLKTVMGTASSDFVNATLFQLQAAARLPNSGVSETAVNSALALIEACNPKDELEGALIAQMACTHAAAMAVLGRIGGAHGGDRHVATMAAASARLLRAFAVQVETLRRLRNGSAQFVRVEHVHVNDGGQAVVGKIGR